MTHLQCLVSHGYCQDYLLLEQQRRHQEAVDFLFGGSYKKDWSSSAALAGCIVPLGASNMMRSIQQLLGIHVS